MRINKQVESIRIKWTSRFDEEPSDWITVNGTHIPLDDDGKMYGKVADKIREHSISPKLREHFDKENKKVADMMKGKCPASGRSVEMANGQILERYSMAEMKSYILKEAKSAGRLSSDEAISILYRNGDIASYIEGDDTSKMKLTDIKGVIYDNASTSAYSGAGVKIENYNETLAGEKMTRYGTDEDEDDWRIDFE